MLFKRLCYSCLFYLLLIILIFLILLIKLLMRHVEPNVSEKLLADEKITASCQRNLCRKHYIKRCKQQK